MGPWPRVIALVACTLSVVAAADDPVMGVVANSAKEYAALAPARSAAAVMKLADLGQADLATADLTAYAAVLVSAQVLPKSKTDALGAYVDQGGLLVAMGRAGEYDDSDGDGKRSPGDRRVWALSKLCGIHRSGVAGRFQTWRVWGRDPVFMAFPQQGPADFSGNRLAGTLCVCETASPYASGRFVPGSTRQVGGRKAYGWYHASRCVGESAYLTVRHHGRGAAVYVAENLADPGANASQKALLRALLSSLALTLRGGSPPPVPLLANDQGDLVTNGDMQDVCTIVDRYAGNDAKPPFPFPFGWQYNSWGGGKYRIEAKPQGEGGWYYSAVYTGTEGVAANSACVLRYQHFTFAPRLGRTYALSCALRSDREVRIRLWGKLVSGSPWRVLIATVQADPAPWRTVAHRFTIPATALAGSQMRPGFWLDFTISGKGHIDLNDVRLREVAP